MFAAVDIGASSGRVILGRISTGSGTPGANTADGGPARATLDVVHRFPNGVVESDGGLRWDFDALFAEVLTGLAAAGKAAVERGETITSIGIDTWAVDYGLVNAAGELTAQPYSYRDERSRAAVARVHGQLDPARLYATTGLQFLQFNTLYQLATEPALDGLQAMLIPDLIAFLLTGQRRTEATNASTTGLFDAVAGEWATELFGRPGPAQGPVPAADPARRNPGDPAPRHRRADRAARGNDGGGRRLARHRLRCRRRSRRSRRTSPTFPPAPGPSWGWNCTTRCSPKPAAWRTSPMSAAWTAPPGTCATSAGSGCSANASAPGPKSGYRPAIGELLDAAAALPPGGPRINPDDPAFIAPDNMPDRIRAAARNTGDVLPAEPAAVVRCILDSLAAGYARTIADAERLAGVAVDVVHIVGGGSQNALLCQLTAQATGKPVIAGPVEATALGNVLVQARAAGVATGGLPQLRSIVGAGTSLRRYEPLDLIANTAKS